MGRLVGWTDSEFICYAMLEVSERRLSYVCAGMHVHVWVL